MRGDLRVTMVATGISEALKAAPQYPRVVANELRPKKVANYDDLDAPTVIRNRRDTQDLPNLVDENGMDYLEIPAFLRKQAD